MEKREGTLQRAVRLRRWHEAVEEGEKALAQAEEDHDTRALLVVALAFLRRPLEGHLCVLEAVLVEGPQGDGPFALAAWRALACKLFTGARLLLRGKRFAEAMHLLELAREVHTEHPRTAPDADILLVADHCQEKAGVGNAAAAWAASTARLEGTPRGELEALCCRFRQGRALWRAGEEEEARGVLEACVEKGLGELCPRLADRARAMLAEVGDKQE